MIIERTTELAEKVLNILVPTLSTIKNADASCVVRTYQNGRENGFHVSISVLSSIGLIIREVWFSEFRRSDDVVVYPHMRGDYGKSWDGVLPGGAYQNKRLFQTPEEAALFCFDVLTGKADSIK